MLRIADKQFKGGDLGNEIKRKSTKMMFDVSGTVNSRIT
jgi:hypothetical protein